MENRLGFYRVMNLSELFYLVKNFFDNSGLNLTNKFDQINELIFNLKMIKENLIFEFARERC